MHMPIIKPDLICTFKEWFVVVDFWLFHASIFLQICECEALSRKVCREFPHMLSEYLSTHWSL